MKRSALEETKAVEPQQLEPEIFENDPLLSGLEEFDLDATLRRVAEKLNEVGRLVDTVKEHIAFEALRHELESFEYAIENLDLKIKH